MSVRLCVVCRHRPVSVPDLGVCERCSGALAADGHPLTAARPAPAEMSAEILAELRERVARLEGGVPFERELSQDEIEVLLQGFPQS